MITEVILIIREGSQRGPGQPGKQNRWADTTPIVWGSCWNSQHEEHTWVVGMMNRAVVMQGAPLEVQVPQGSGDY